MKKQDRTEPEPILGALCAGALATSFFVTPSKLPDLDLCWFKTLTHLACPGCGLTHSFLAIGHGQWSQAWAYHPFGFFWYVMALYGLSRPFLRKLKAVPIGRIDLFLSTGYFWAGVAVAMILVWALRSFV